MAKLQLKCTKLPGDEFALTNKVLVHPDDAVALRGPKPNPVGDFIFVNGFVFTYEGHPKMAKGTIGLSAVQRRFLSLAFNDAVDCVPYTPSGEQIYLSSLTLEYDFFSKGTKKTLELKSEDVNTVIKRELGNQVFTIGQSFILDLSANTVEFKVKGAEVVDLEAIAKGGEKPAAIKAERGVVHVNTVCYFEKAKGSGLTIIGGEAEDTTVAPIFRPDWNFAAMGIGGLDKEFSDIFRRAFASRCFPPSIVAKLGIQHVKGILLYGPPGTGKTLMARQIAKMLNGKEPKIVNGPEILNKYVGASEENIRNLFKEAAAEYKDKKEKSDLHVIIFDEIDAICRQRGSRQDGTGVHDTVVNQLLSMIDGVDALNNILVIGMTNRKDLIDDALLRPGRLEVHMEINLPDEKGRVQILNIHTTKMRTSKMMSDDIDLLELAKQTKNFSGAEIEGLVKAATACAFQRQLDVTNGIRIKEGEIKVTMQDFLFALGEIKPAFGVDQDEFEGCARNGIVIYGPKVEKLIKTIHLFVQQVRSSNRTPLVSVLLEGPPGAGKTAVAARMALESGYPSVKLVSPELLIGYTETGKFSKITKVFEDAYKSPLSCIVIDDIERLLDYVKIGPRFSNVILQALLVLLKKEPPKGRRLLVLATTSNPDVLRDLDFMEVFNAVLPVTQIGSKDELRRALTELKVFGSDRECDEAATAFTGPISIKKLIMVAEMAKQGPAASTLERFKMHLTNASY